MIASRRIAGVLIAVAVGLAAGCAKTPPPQPPSPDVVILVLDNFTPAVSPSPTPTREGHPSKGNCPKSGLPSNEVGSGGGGSGMPPGVSHGEVVYSTIAGELDKHANVKKVGPTTVPSAVRADAWTHTKTNDRVILAGMDIGNYNTDTMATKIDNLIHDLRYDKDLKFAKFVLNMSFVIVPCDLKSWWTENGGDDKQDVAALINNFRANIENDDYVKDLKDTLDKYTKAHTVIQLRDLYADPALDQLADVVLTNLFLAKVYRQVQENSVQKPGEPDQPPLSKSPLYDAAFRNDPLRKLLTKYPSGGDEEVIPVGAAGNGVLNPDSDKLLTFALPFAPALWNSVVSVSAAQTAAKPPVLTDYSNSGEFMLDPSNDWKLRGTSFATPHLSALEALYLLNGGKGQCGPPGTAPDVPTLGYADSDNQRYDWNNYWLDPAAIGGQATTRCPDFATRVNS